MTPKKNILIVDDSPIVIERLKEMLMSVKDIEPLIFCGSYNAAVDILSKKKPNIIILDINLPDKNGIELLRHIRDKHKGIIVIMLSNQAGEYYRNLCKLLGADYFIDKSNEFELVPGLISSLS